MQTSALHAQLEPNHLPCRYIVLGSALLSLIGACVIIFSALRFRELSKRFFAIRLIFFLALTDCLAAAFNILGVFVDVDQLMRPGSKLPLLCAVCFTPPAHASCRLCTCMCPWPNEEDQTGLCVWDGDPFAGALFAQVQAVGVLYFNLASIMWTSCFAFTLYRDVVPSHRRHALRKYEMYFHLLCWPVPAILAGTIASLGYLGDSGSWCGMALAYTKQYLICFYLPLLAAFTFNLVTYTAVLSHSCERRVSRITSLYLLGFAIVWLPSLVYRLQVLLSPTHTPCFALAALEALCMPLQVCARPARTCARRMRARPACTELHDRPCRIAHASEADRHLTSHVIAFTPPRLAAQGALNALVYGWSLPSIRDVYRTMLLGTDGIDTLQVSPSDPSLAGRSPSYSPPDFEASFEASLPSVTSACSPHVLCGGAPDSAVRGFRQPTYARGVR